MVEGKIIISQMESSEFLCGLRMLVVRYHSVQEIRDTSSVFTDFIHLLIERYCHQPTVELDNYTK